MILRSAFWLTVGFFLVAPHGTDFGAVLGQAKDQVVTAGIHAGEQLVVSQLLTSDTLASAVVQKLTHSNPSAVLPMQDSPAALFVFPRSRPAAMG